jgi:hypothetical protein
VDFWRAVANIVFGRLSAPRASSADPSSANNPGIMTLLSGYTMNSPDAQSQKMTPLYRNRMMSHGAIDRHGMRPKSHKLRLISRASRRYTARQSTTTNRLLLTSARAWDDSCL